MSVALPAPREIEAADQGPAAAAATCTESDGAGGAHASAAAPVAGVSDRCGRLVLRSGAKAKATVAVVDGGAAAAALTATGLRGAGQRGVGLGRDRAAAAHARMHAPRADAAVVPPRHVVRGQGEPHRDWQRVGGRRGAAAPRQRDGGVPEVVRDGRRDGVEGEAARRRQQCELLHSCISRTAAAEADEAGGSHGCSGMSTGASPMPV